MYGHNAKCSTLKHLLLKEIKVLIKQFTKIIPKTVTLPKCLYSLGFKMGNNLQQFVSYQYQD